jgi:hypothetical protein
MCQLLKVLRSGYYKWINKITSKKEMEDKKILIEIKRYIKLKIRISVDIQEYIMN